MKRKMKRKQLQTIGYNKPKKTKVKLEPLPTDSKHKHPLSIEAIRTAVKEIRGKRFIQGNCAEHTGLLAHFFLHGKIIPSSAGDSKFEDYPYQRSFAVETIDHRRSKSFIVVERDNVLFRSADSTISPFLPIQSEAIKTEQDCIFIEDKQTYKSVYCSIQELPRKLERMAGAQGWVCAAISLSRIKRFTTMKKAQAFYAECQQDSDKFDQGHLLFVYHFTQALNLSLPPERQVADNQRTLFIELANLNRGKETLGPCVAYSIKDLGFNLTNDPDLFGKPSLFNNKEKDYFFDKITVTPLRDLTPVSEVILKTETPFPAEIAGEEKQTATSQTGTAYDPIVIDDKAESFPVMLTPALPVDVWQQELLLSQPSITVPAPVSMPVLQQTVLTTQSQQSRQDLLTKFVHLHWDKISYNSEQKYEIWSALGQKIIGDDVVFLMPLFSKNIYGYKADGIKQILLLINDPEAINQIAYYALTRDYWIDLIIIDTLLETYFQLIDSAAEAFFPTVFKQLSSQKQFDFVQLAVNKLKYAGGEVSRKTLLILGRNGLLDPFWQEICDFTLYRSKHASVYFIGKMLNNAPTLLIEILLNRSNKSFLKLAEMKIAPPNSTISYEDTLSPELTFLTSAVIRAVTIQNVQQLWTSANVYSIINSTINNYCKYFLKSSAMRPYLSFSSHYQQQIQDVWTAARDNFALVFNPNHIQDLSHFWQNITSFLELRELLILATLRKPSPPTTENMPAASTPSLLTTKNPFPVKIAREEKSVIPAIPVLTPALSATVLESIPVLQQTELTAQSQKSRQNIPSASIFDEFIISGQNPFLKSLATNRMGLLTRTAQPMPLKSENKFGPRY